MKRGVHIGRRVTVLVRVESSSRILERAHFLGVIIEVRWLASW